MFLPPKNRNFIAIPTFDLSFIFLTFGVFTTEGEKTCNNNNNNNFRGAGGRGMRSDVYAHGQTPNKQVSFQNPRFEGRQTAAVGDE